jgi:hypothetical protein
MYCFTVVKGSLKSRQHFTQDQQTRQQLMQDQQNSAPTVALMLTGEQREYESILYSLPRMGMLLIVDALLTCCCVDP